MKTRAFAAWCGCIGLLGLADQLTKRLALERLYEGPHVLLPVLELRLAFNPGAAFGLLGGPLQPGADPRLAWSNLLLCALASGVSVFFLVWLRRSPALGWQAAGLACIIGGALGNLVDRLHRGFVVDFIGLHWRHWYFPHFNLADMAITLGVAAVLWAGWRDRG